MVPLANALTQAEKNAIKNNMTFNLINAFNISNDNATGLVGDVVSPTLIRFDAANQSTHYDGGRVEFNSDVTETAKSQTWIMYFNSTYTAAQGYFFNRDWSNENGDILMQQNDASCGAANCLSAITKDSGGNIASIAVQDIPLWTNKSFKIVALSINSSSFTNITAYYNSRKLAQGSSAAEMATSTNKIAVMNGIFNNFPHKAHVKVAMIINFSLNSDELGYVLERFEAGDFNLTGEAVVPQAIDINGTINNTVPRLNDIINATFNATSTGTLDIGQIIINDTGAKRFFNFTLSGGSDKFSQNFSVSCVAGCVINITGLINDSNGNTAHNITIFTVAGLDSPNITLNGNNFFNDRNTTIISFNASQNALLNFTLTDDVDVFGFELNITNQTGGVILNFTNNTMSGFNQTFSRFINASGPQGRYNFSITVWDSHTAQSIPVYKINDGIGDSIVFDDTIRIKSEGAIITKTIKKFDKYEMKFSYIPLLAPARKTFYIESDGEIFYRNGSSYKGHFIDWKNRKWIDFEGISAKLTVERISSNKWKVEFDDSSSEIYIKSIGGLNSKTYHFSYYLSDAQINWYIPTEERNVFARNSIFVSFNVTGDGRNQTIINLFNSTNNIVDNASVVANGTGTYFYNTTFSIDFVDHTYRVNATHIDINRENTSSTTRTFENLIITNVSTFEAYPGINFTILDELNSTRIRGTATATFDYNGTSSQVKNFTFTSRNANNFTVYIFPPRESITNDYKITYSATGYQERVFSVNDAIFTNSTQTRNLFLLATADGLFATFRVIDSFQDTISGVEVKQELTDGTLIEVRETDDGGTATLFVDPDTSYKFTFTKSGFKTHTITLRVTTTDIITITLEKESDDDETSFFTGTSYFFLPKNSVLVNNTQYTFEFNLSSTFWNITGCIFKLRNESDLLRQVSCHYNGSKSNVSVNYNTTNQTIIISEAIYQLNGTSNQTVSNHYRVVWQYEGSFSLKNFLDDITTFSEGGFDDFGRFLLGILITLFVVGAMALMSSEFREPEVLIPSAWLMTALFSYLDWYRIPLDTIPDAVGQQWVVFILITLAGGAFLARKHW